jgi:hypothetical protein
MKSLFVFGVVLWALTDLVINMNTKLNHGFLKFMLVFALLTIVFSGVAILAGYGDS